MTDETICEASTCVEAIMAWLLFGNGAICLGCHDAIKWNERTP